MFCSSDQQHSYTGHVLAANFDLKVLYKSQFIPQRHFGLDINTGLMITASHQTFSGQIEHLSGQTIFGQTNLSYIISGKVIGFTKEKHMS